MRRRLIALVVILAVAIGGAYWWFNRSSDQTRDLVLHGNVEMREVSVAFNDSGRIASVNVEEGDRVKQGDVLARLETSRVVPALAQAQAQADAQSAVVAKLKAGSRPEEIAQARATAAAAHADANNAALAFERARMLSTSTSSASIAKSQLDAAQAASDAATARANAADQAVALVVAGPRAEDIRQAEAQLAGATASRDLIKQQLADAELKAPVDGIIRSRLLEPGEIASAQRPVLSIAIVDPKWVRAYLSEPDLARVKQGMAAMVAVDGAPAPLTGRVGFISPVAEFTPRAIQTEELRTSLVYEVRILVDDRADVLRLGMPATVKLEPGTAVAASAPATLPPPQTPSAAPAATP
jgi:HlyD family secretion protein